MNKYFVLKSYTIKEAIDIIDEYHDRVVLVVNEEEKLIGIVSQGDIIRALSSGKNLYSYIGDIFRTDFIYATKKDMEYIVQIFRKKKITLLPIVDEEFRVLDVITLSHIYDYLIDGKV